MAPGRLSAWRREFDEQEQKDDKKNSLKILLIQRLGAFP
jgi:hypothetical protein